MNTELARRHMMTQQYRANNILDDDLLTLLQSTPRENFVPSEYEAFAFADMQIPLRKDADDARMLTPLLEAKILDAVKIKKTDKVLEIGTGSAYLTCLLGKLSQSVVSCDNNETFIQNANDKLVSHGVHHVELLHADGYAGLEDQGPFDVIIYTGALPQLPKSVSKQLNPGGRLFAFVGKSPVIKAYLFVKSMIDNSLEKSTLFETDLPMLHIENPTKEFVF